MIYLIWLLTYFIFIILITGFHINSYFLELFIFTLLLLIFFCFCTFFLLHPNKLIVTASYFAVNSMLLSFFEYKFYFADCTHPIMICWLCTFSHYLEGMLRPHWFCINFLISFIRKRSWSFIADILVTEEVIFFHYVLVYILKFM